ncbi:hypothetical protein [Cryptosporangium aurantiacum]|uniref:hypothetical protein n=1 Tax=Cryptosporangium aurantiacum TaxID=134849 RepID=UPI000933A5E4|nr:hypothetical protein [Cryptosporangium aurantiacum]
MPDDERCIHDLPISQCADCRAQALGYPRRVAITAGGSVFHLDANCDGLRDGQGSVRRRGGVPADLTWVPIGEVFSKGRGSCKRCCSHLPPP